MRVLHSKMNLREHQYIPTRYIQHQYGFLHKVLYKGIVSNHSYVMVCVETVKDAQRKIKIQDTFHRNSLYR